MVELTSILAVAIAGLAAVVAFDALAVQWGMDSRPGIGDDHRR